MTEIEVFSRADPKELFTKVPKKSLELRANAKSLVTCVFLVNKRNI